MYVAKSVLKLRSTLSIPPFISPSILASYIFKGIKDKVGRNKNIYKAHWDYGYTLSEIGRALNIHYTTISKIVNKK